MKKMISLFLCLALLLCICSFSGCEKDKTLSATGEYNGQKISMTYSGPTDIPFPYDMSFMKQVNGYTVFFDYSNYVEGDIYTAGFNVMDAEGNILFDKVYDGMTHVDEEGWCAVQEYPREAGVYRMLHVSGESYAITKEEFYSHFDKMYEAYDKYNDFAQEPDFLALRDGQYTGYLYNGLAPYVMLNPDEESRYYYLMGLCDAEGNIVIPAFIPACHDVKGAVIALSEDRIYFQDYDKIGYVTVTRE